MARLPAKSKRRWRNPYLEGHLALISRGSDLSLREIREVNRRLGVHTMHDALDMVMDDDNDGQYQSRESDR